MTMAQWHTGTRGANPRQVALEKTENSLDCPKSRPLLLTRVAMDSSQSASAAPITLSTARSAMVALAQTLVEASGQLQLSVAEGRLLQDCSATALLGAEKVSLLGVVGTSSRGCWLGVR